MTQEIKRTILEVGLALLAFWLIGAILIVCLAGGGPTAWMSDGALNMVKIRILSGYSLGVAMSMLSFWHIAYTAVRAMDLQATPASRKVSLMSAVRMITFMVVTVLAYFTGWFSALAVVVGGLMMRPAAMLQPTVHKWMFGKQEAEAALAQQKTEAGPAENAESEAPQDDRDLADALEDDWEENPPEFIKWLERKTCKHDVFSRFK